jgi:hypothetical protein
MDWTGRDRAGIDRNGQALAVMDWIGMEWTQTYMSVSIQPLVVAARANNIVSNQNLTKS